MSTRAVNQNVEEKQMMCLFLASECDICSFDEMLLMASVVKNRARIYNKSISEILLDENQFYLNEEAWSKLGENNKIKSQIINVSIVSVDYDPVDTTIIYFWRRKNPTVLPWMKNTEIVHYKKYHVFAKAKNKIN